MPESLPLPDGEVRPTAREEAIGRAEIARMWDRFVQDGETRITPATEAAMAGWLAAVLCGYRLELMTGEKVLGR
jgi:hypothetical protein